MPIPVTSSYFPVLADIYQAAQRIAEVAEPTPLQKSIRLSKKIRCRNLAQEGGFTESSKL